MSVGSDESFLRFYESYARAPKDEIQSLPKEPGDFRRRLKRETIRGRYGVFHENIETYLFRQWRAFTASRMGLFACGAYVLTAQGLFSFRHTFPNLDAYKHFSDHPNFKLMGRGWATFYLLRPVFWGYITFRLSKTTLEMCKDHWQGKDDQHYFWFYDTLYPDLYHDSDDQRYINFRYTDQKVVPEPLTGYYPYDYLRYNSFLNKKEDQAFGKARTRNGDTELAPIV